MQKIAGIERSKNFFTHKSHFRNPLFGAAVTIGVLVALCLAATARPRAQNQPGRILVSPRADVIFECNVDGSNCFYVTGASSSAGDPGGGDGDPSVAYGPSMASNGTIAFQAAFAPDGTCAGYSSQGICASHVFVMDADGTNVRQITFNPPYDPKTFFFGGDLDVSISPDGTKVAFVSSRNDAYDRDGTPWAHSAVYVVNIDGSGLQQVTPFTYDGNGSPHGDMYSVAWSPDSTKLAFKGTAYGSECGTYFGGPIDFLAVGIVNVDGTGYGYIACDNADAAGGATALDWSSDGTLIADARDSIGYGEPAIRFTSPSGQSRGGLTLAQLRGPNSSSQICPSDRHCFHFSPDSTKIAYENTSPPDNPSFNGVSTINVDGTGRVDVIQFGSAYDVYTLHGVWWAAGAVLPTATGLTLPPTRIEVWPGFSHQLVPSLLDSQNQVILHTAGAFFHGYVYQHNCAIDIGPYGLVTLINVQGGAEGSAITATNAGLTSNQVIYKCWASPPCTYSLSPISENFGSGGGADSVGVIADPQGTDSTCPWTAVSNASWITVTSGRQGNGTSNVSFSVAPNTGPARQGTMTIAGATFTVDQDQIGPPVLQSITVAPGSASVPAGLTQQFTATGHYSDSSTIDLTTSVTWSSSDTSIATISNAAGTHGRATGITVGGPVTIAAALGAFSGTAQLIVAAPQLVSLAVSPTNGSVPAGSSQQFTAIGTYSDGSAQNITGSVTWGSSNTAVATIAATGLASAQAAGTTTISAQQGSASNSTTLTVTSLQSLTLSPLSPNINVGSTLQFTATGHYSDGTTRDLTSIALWTSSKTSVATITASGGLATAKAKGSTVIRAASGGFTASTTLTVMTPTLQSITVSPATATISVGSTQQLTATGLYSDGTTDDLTSSVTWSSSMKMVASVSGSGLVTALKVGTSTITAKSGKFSGSGTVTVR